jgi:hypothetical protein
VGVVEHPVSEDEVSSHSSYRRHVAQAPSAPNCPFAPFEVEVQCHVKPESKPDVDSLVDGITFQNGFRVLDVLERGVEAGSSTLQDQEERDSANRQYRCKLGKSWTERQIVKEACRITLLYDRLVILS